MAALLLCFGYSESAAIKTSSHALIENSLSRESK